MGAKDCTPEVDTSGIIVDFQWHVPMDCQLHFLTEFHFSHGSRWNYPMDFQWHVPMKFLVFNILPWTWGRRKCGRRKWGRRAFRYKFMDLDGSFEEAFPKQAWARSGKNQEVPPPFLCRPHLFPSGSRRQVSPPRVSKRGGGYC